MVMSGFPTVRKGLMISFNLSSHIQANQRMSSCKSNPVAQEGGCATSTCVTAAHPRLREKYGKSKRLISTSNLVFLEVLVMSGQSILKSHLKFKSKYKQCLVY